jgi:hypothetical protein
VGAPGIDVSFLTPDADSEEEQAEPKIPPPEPIWKGTTFGGQMVLALLEGRKTQTRRLGALRFLNANQKARNSIAQVQQMRSGWHFYQHVNGKAVDIFHCQSLFKEGDHRYVREKWRAPKPYDDSPGRILDEKCPIQFAAGLPPNQEMDPDWGRWRTAVYMPRRYSRCHFIVTKVHVHRLQEMTEKDFLAEGIDVGDYTTWTGRITGPSAPYFYLRNKRDPSQLDCLMAEFASYWDGVCGNAKKIGCGWYKNPYVFCATFKIVKPPTKE